MAWSDIAQLRAYIDDKQDGTHQFEDYQLQAKITEYNGDLHGAAADIWGMKAATVSDWYQINMDGSFMSREQVFEHCLKMQSLHAQQRGIVSVPIDSGFTTSSTASSEF